MTNPMGRMFLSYRHSHQELAAALDQSLREHGIPIWRDVRDVGPDPLQEQIIEDLSDPELAGGIVLVSEDVVDSEIILEVELPRLYERWQTDEEFFVIVVLAPDVGYSEAEQILAESSSPYDFSKWHMESLETNSTSNESSTSDGIISAVMESFQTNSDQDSLPAFDDIVTVVLERRLQAVHKALGTDEPIECSLDTYDRPSYADSLPVRIDWSAYFDDGLPTASVWNEHLRTVIETVIDQLQQTTPNRSLRFRGNAHLPAAFAAGHALQTTRGIDAAWMQPDGSGGLAQWKHNLPSDESGLRAGLERNDVMGSDLAVFASITDDVAPEVGRTKSNLPKFNGILKLAHETEQPPELTPSQAAHAATLFRRELRKSLNELSNTSTIHLFMAAPAGLAFLFGQMTNTLPVIQTYALDTTSGPRIYRPAVKLQ